MHLFSSLFDKNKSSYPVTNYTEFWSWFQFNEKAFFKAVKSKKAIQQDFFLKLAPQLKALHEGYWFLAGMYDNETAELIITADGIIKNIVFVEELVAAAPHLERWKITALKQPAESDDYALHLNDHTFDDTTMRFYEQIRPDMPDEIDITIAHKDYNPDTKKIIEIGTSLTLDNYLGELNTIEWIDNVSIINPKDAETELIPFNKLKDYLQWRQKECTESCNTHRPILISDEFTALQATLENGTPMIAHINLDALDWDHKVNYPWMVSIRLIYKDQTSDGMPNSETALILNNIKIDIKKALEEEEYFIYIGEQLGNSQNQLYIVSTEFRKPSKVLYDLQQGIQNSISMEFNIYKDKYWQSFNHFT